jgi:hypothetical protein
MKKPLLTTVAGLALIAQAHAYDACADIPEARRMYDTAEQAVKMQIEMTQGLPVAVAHTSVDRIKELRDHVLDTLMLHEQQCLYNRKTLDQSMDVLNKEFAKGTFTQKEYDAAKRTIEETQRLLRNYK